MLRWAKPHPSPAKTCTGTFWLLQLLNKLSRKGFPCKGGGRRCFGRIIALFPGCEEVASEVGSLLPAFLFSHISLFPAEQRQQGRGWLPLPRLHAATLWLSDAARLHPSASGAAHPALTKPSSSPEPSLRPGAILGTGQGLVVTSQLQNQVDIGAGFQTSSERNPPSSRQGGVRPFLKPCLAHQELVGTACITAQKNMHYIYALYMHCIGQDGFFSEPYSGSPVTR